MNHLVFTPVGTAVPCSNTSTSQREPSGQRIPATRCRVRQRAVTAASGVIAAALLIQKMARNKGMAKNPIHKPYAVFAAPSGSARGPVVRPREVVVA